MDEIVKQGMAKWPNVRRSDADSFAEGPLAGSGAGPPELNALPVTDG